MKAVIDRFEGEFAVVVLDNGASANISKALVPDACEGDVIEITTDVCERERTEKRIAEKVKKLFE